MTIASSCGWWILLASSIVNVIAGSSTPLVLGDHPDSWTFYTTLRYVFLDLEDCPVEVSPIITLISPSGRDVHEIYTIKYSHIYIFSFTFM